MLNIYYGRDSIDKEKFMYQTIEGRGFGPGKRVVVIVPDQYTLEAERQAFRVLKRESIIGLDIFGFSRLGSRLLRNTGRDQVTFVDKYGRQMLIASIISEKEANLRVFRKSGNRMSFITMVNDFISRMKQCSITPEELEGSLEYIKGNRLLKEKVSDLSMIYTEYEKKIEGRYTDTEDYAGIYAEEAGVSEYIKGAEVWLYGFDSISPSDFNVIRNLLGNANNVNVVLTYDQDERYQRLFEITSITYRKLVETAQEAGCEVGRVEEIKADRVERAEEIGFLEQNIFSELPNSFQSSVENSSKNEGSKDKGVRLVRAANFYNEAETAACEILHLIRDCGYRYRDIVLICNDGQQRAGIIQRVFQEYGIDLFLDSKRSILNAKVTIYILSLMDIVLENWRTNDIFNALKTGYTDFSDEQIERLEVYVTKYRIRGNMWKKPFVRGNLFYTNAEIEEFEAMRQEVAGILTGLEKAVGSSKHRPSKKSSKTVSEFIREFYRWITEELGVPERLQKEADLQVENEDIEGADETVQIWDRIMGLLEQIDELSGQEAFSLSLFSELLETGLSDIDIGVIPTGIDDLMYGTMQRTRSGPVRAVFVLGVNENVLPIKPSVDGLFGSEEIETFQEVDIAVARMDYVRAAEERLAIYRNLVKPSDLLYVSYAVADNEGAELLPSPLIDDIRRILPELELEEDVINSGDELSLIASGSATVRNLTQRMNGAIRKKIPVDGVWKPVYEWYSKKYSGIRKGLEFDNRVHPLSEEYTDLMFTKRRDKRILSASKLEKYSRCPFSYFIRYGLRPEEVRVMEASSREIGDVYHNCIMRLTEKLSKEDLWDTVTDNECRQLVKDVVRLETEDYREGLFCFSNREKYRSNRIERVCMETLNILVEHMRAGSISDSRYEVPFGEGYDMEPIVIEVDGIKIFIEGRIDRMDVLENGRIKIIDYKSSKKNLSIEEVESGYKLQLMIYMEAACGGGAKPAGVFYFHITEPKIAFSGANNDLSMILSEDDCTDAIRANLEKHIRKAFKLSGLVVNDVESISEMDGVMEKYSDIIPVTKKKDGTYYSNGKSLVEEEDFEELREILIENIKELSRGMIKGDIELHPMRVKGESECSFCEYRGICRFDEQFKGCVYKEI